MKNRQAIELFQALKQLDGYREGESQVLTPYRFGAKASYGFARNINLLKPIITDIDVTSNKLLKVLLKADETGLSKGDPRVAPFLAEREKLLEEECGYTPHQIPLSALNLEVNPVPPSVLADLAPVINENEPIAMS